MTAPQKETALKILAADRPDPLEYFDKKAASIGAEVVYGDASEPSQIESMAEDADAVIVFRTSVTEAAIKRMKKCKLLLRQGIGVDLIDVSAATRAGIFVSNVPDYCVEEVSSHAMMLLLAAVRNLMDYHRVTTAKGWGFYGATRKVPALTEMKLGLVGVGKIGRAMARKALVFGLRVAAYDPYVHQDVFDWIGAERIRGIDELLRTCDIISLHAPLTPETKAMFGRREFELMKPGSYFINTARGGIVDLAALDDALGRSHIAAAGLDVFEDEPLDPDHPILKRDNLIATPHVAFYSERSLVRVITETIDEVVRVLEGRRPLNLVNPEVYSHLR
ncbi:C-terminal binding protein [Candidatus Sumerlaeota bacterium]|nr:C-terminal binding protein [Candidatus Sumerlaeota bacterium]